MNPSHFTERVQHLIADVLDMSGSILYSSWDTVRRGDIYIMGLNPGGDPSEIRTTIRNELELIRSGQKRCNSYLSEDWSNTKKTYGVGRHPLQIHLQMLIAKLGYNLEDLCASNLIFLRSPDQRGVNLQMVDRYNFWNVHEIIIGCLQPRVLLVFGNGAISPYAYLCHMHFKKFQCMPREDIIPGGHGSWKCRAFETELQDRKIMVVGLPHLSRYLPNDKPQIIDWLRTKMPKRLEG
jgi:hypothetical protein